MDTQALLRSLNNTISPKTYSKGAKSVYTFIFSRQKFSKGDVLRWADDNGYDSTNLHRNGGNWRMPQRDINDFADEYFSTDYIEEGLKSLVGHLRTNLESK